MTDKVQKIREEIEIVVNRRLNLLNGDYFDLNKEADGFINEIMDIIDSSQEEPVSKDLEKELSAYVNSKEYTNSIGTSGLLLIARHFANWQKQQDQENIELAEDHAILAGMEKMKEQMMAKAIDAEVLENYDGKVIKYDETILDEKLSDCKVFDKVKVIIIKED